MAVLDRSYSYESYERQEEHRKMFGPTDRSISRSSSESSTNDTDITGQVTDGTEPLLHVTAPSRLRLVVTMTACLFLHMSSFGMVVGLGVVYVELISYFDAPRSAAALVQSMFGGFCLGGGILFSPLVTKYDPGLVIMISSVCATITFSVSALAPNIETVIVLIGVMTGLAVSINILGAFVVVSWVFHRNRKFALSVLTLGATLGQIALPNIVTSLIDTYYWTGSMPILGAMMFLNGIPCGLIVHYAKTYFQKGDAQKVKNSKILDFGCIADAAFMIFLSSCFSFNATGPVEQWFLVDMSVVKGFTTSMGATLLSLNGVFGFTGRVVGTLILKKYPNTNQELHMAYGFCSWGISHVVISYSPSYTGMALGTVLRGLSAGLIVAFLPGLQIDLRGIEKFPQTVSITNLVNGMGSIVGGSLGGLSFDITRSYNLMFSIACGVNIYNAITMIVIYVIFKHRRNKHGYDTI